MLERRQARGKSRMPRSSTWAADEGDPGLAGGADDGADDDDVASARPKSEAGACWRAATLASSSVRTATGVPTMMSGPACARIFAMNPSSCISKACKSCHPRVTAWGWVGREPPAR